MFTKVKEESNPEYTLIRLAGARPKVIQWVLLTDKNPKPRAEAAPRVMGVGILFKLCN
jgi:hypothetical protein